jgi:hypothetical protein
MQIYDCIELTWISHNNETALIKLCLMKIVFFFLPIYFFSYLFIFLRKNVSVIELLSDKSTWPSLIKWNMKTLR